MSIKKTLVIVLVIISNTIFSQQSLNNYKYVIVPKKYDFLKSEDKYQVNSLTKFLFKKEGFNTLFDSDVKPQELVNNPCSALVSRVKKNSTMFTTKLVIELVNCRNEIVHTSTEGRSKQKDYKKAYQEALRKAFESISSLDYKYNPLKVPSVAKKDEIVVEQKTTDIVKEVIPVEVEKEEIKEVVEEVETLEIETIEPKQELQEVEEVEEKTTPSGILYAQANALGFQLVDSTPKVVYVLLKSSKEDVYFLRNKKGIIYKENNKWLVEYYELDKLIQKTLIIKF